MKAAMILKQGIPLWLSIVVLLAGCAGVPPSTPPPSPAEAPPPEVKGEIKRVVEVEADGLTFHYLRQSFWAEEEFSAHLANQAKFETDFKEDFEQGLAQRNVSTSDYSFSFDSATRSTIALCDISNAITLSGEDEYYAQFEWLLRPLVLDFIYDDFKESENGLSWQDSIKDIPTTVTVKLPTIDNIVYKAWKHPIGHCHAHAWWTD